MAQDKKTKVKDIETLRKILDELNDPSIKKTIPKDNRNLDSIRKRLSGDTAKAKTAYVSSSEFLSKRPDSLEPRVTVHKNEEETKQPDMKQIKPVELSGDTKEEITLNALSQSEN